MPWEEFPIIRTYLGADNELLFKIIRVGQVDVRITYPLSNQEKCHADAMQVLESFVISYVNQTPEP